jgi:hypothetical protein
MLKKYTLVNAKKKLVVVNSQTHAKVNAEKKLLR